MHVATVGLDLAKNIFHVHGVTDAGEVAFNKPLRRAQVLKFFERLTPCLVGIESCGSSHYWARELTRLGHAVRLMPPIYVKPYVKRGKSDAIDAEAICEAVTRPTMRFVPVKSESQQALLTLHRARELIIRQRTQLVNTLRGLLGEFGISLARGRFRVVKFAQEVADGRDLGLPGVAHDVIGTLCQHLLDLEEKIHWYELRLRKEARRDARTALLQTIPGVGPVTASAIAASIGDAGQFRNGREFAAWLGLTPKNKSSGGKERFGRITRMGDGYLRHLLVVGMTSLVRQTRSHPERANKWLMALLEKKPIHLATVAMANKTARIIWAVLNRSEPYSPRTEAIA